MSWAWHSSAKACSYLFFIIISGVIAQNNYADVLSFLLSQTFKDSKKRREQQSSFICIDIVSNKMNRCLELIFHSLVFDVFKWPWKFFVGYSFYNYHHSPAHLGTLAIFGSLKTTTKTADLGGLKLLTAVGGWIIVILNLLLLFWTLTHFFSTDSL